MEAIVKKGKTDFTTEEILYLMIPLLLEQLLSLAVGLADSMMVASAGEHAISAVSLVDAIINLFFYIFVGMASGGAATVGQYMGRGEAKTANHAGEQLIGLLVVTSLIITTLLVLFQDLVLQALFGKTSPEIMEQTRIYYSVVILSVPGIALFNGGSALFRMMARTVTSFKASVMMNLVNVAGNALLIFGFGMGVIGVAIPTLVARYLAAGILMWLLYSGRYPMKLSGLAMFRWDRTILKNIIYISIPNGLEECMFHLGRLSLFSFISTLGAASVVANAVGNTLAGFQVFPGRAADMSLETITSQCVGTKEYDKVHYYVKKVMSMGYLLIFACNLVMLLLFPLILRIYGLPADAERLTRSIFTLHGAAGLLLWGLAFMLPGALRAAGDARFTMIASMCCMWLCRVLGAYVIGIVLGFGVVGIWFAQCILDWAVRVLVFSYRYRSGKWREKGIQ